jgi:hypothetical protein
MTFANTPPGISPLANVLLAKVLLANVPLPLIELSQVYSYDFHQHTLRIFATSECPIGEIREPLRLSHTYTRTETRVGLDRVRLQNF